MSRIDLGRLNEADAEIRRIATELGLTFADQEFDVVPESKMLEIMAYRLPVNYSHWSYGRDYEIERTKREYGYSIPYEVVFNSDPCRAYLMETNPFAIQVLVMAHVYAHNDFMTVNRHFASTRRDMISIASEAAGRFRAYEEQYGEAEVEKILDAAHAIQWNIEPDDPSYEEAERRALERVMTREREAARKSAGAAVISSGRYDDLLGTNTAVPVFNPGEIVRRTPPEPTTDLLGYIMTHSPLQLESWKKDVIETVRAQGQYFTPYRRTKIMNEGWATLWHERIMARLLSEGFLDQADHGIFNLYNARVKAHNPRSLNPYLLGYKIFTDLEQRWNTGRFGSDWEACTNPERLRSWDTGAKLGREKLFEVRRTHMDWFFVDEYLSKSVVDELKLYVYLEQDAGSSWETVVAETDWREVKRHLVHSLMNWGIPRISVVNGDYEGGLQLFLRHEWDGFPLDEEYAKRTLTHVFALWGRPVYLETREVRDKKEKNKIIIVDRNGIRTMYPEDYAPVQG